MPSIRITQFAGLVPELHARNKGRTNAQVAHNCMLWDGALRPMPVWQEFKRTSLPRNYNHIYEQASTGTIIEADNFTDAVYLDNVPFAKGTLVGIDRAEFATQGYHSNIRYTRTFNVPAPSLPAGLPTPTFVDRVVDGVTEYAFIPSSSVFYNSQALSQKPVNRILGITFARKTATGLEESPLAILPNQYPFGIMFEGDIVEVFMALTLPLFAQYGITHIRLYRTIAGLDSGEKVGNELDTDWHLIDTMPIAEIINYNDGGASTTDPLDLYLASHFYAPSFPVAHFGLAQGGWFYGISSDGRVMLSERFLHHAWPSENYKAIPERVTDAVTHYDNIYIGTQRNPYIVALAPGEGEQGVQAGVTPFPERLPCLSGTMVAGPSGAIYASPTGVVGLSKSGAKVLTAGLSNAGDILYRKHIDATDTVEAYSEEVRYERTVHGAYWNGAYFGFTESYQENANPDAPISKYCYVYNLGDDINGQKQFQQLVTMDSPNGYLASSLVTDNGLTLKYADRLYRLPLPGQVGDKAYRKARKLCYRWKSKKFVFPGNMTFAAGKIVHDCGGSVKLKLYVDCKCVWQTSVCDCNPFRIPSQIMGKEFEIELIGTSAVYEVHIASSMKELTEQENATG